MNPLTSEYCLCAFSEYNSYFQVNYFKKNENLWNDSIELCMQLIFYCTKTKIKSNVVSFFSLSPILERIESRKEARC